LILELLITKGLRLNRIRFCGSILSAHFIDLLYSFLACPVGCETSLRTLDAGFVLNPMNTFVTTRRSTPSATAKHQSASSRNH